MRICTSSSVRYQSEHKSNITTDMRGGLSHPRGPEPATCIEPYDLARFDAGPQVVFSVHLAEIPLSRTAISATHRRDK